MFMFRVVSLPVLVFLPALCDHLPYPNVPHQCPIVFLGNDTGSQVQMNFSGPQVSGSPVSSKNFQEKDHCRTKGSHYQVVQRVWLSTWDLPLHMKKCKLALRFVGPFPVSKVNNKVAIRLKLSMSNRIHPTIHFSQVIASSGESFGACHRNPMKQTPKEINMVRWKHIQCEIMFW